MQLSFLRTLDPKQLCFPRMFKGDRESALRGDLLAAVLVGQSVIFVLHKRQRKANAALRAILSAEGEKHALLTFGIEKGVGGKGISLRFAVPRSQDVKFLQQIALDPCPFTKAEAQDIEILVRKRQVSF